jgi:hypothetical protein
MFCSWTIGLNKHCAFLPAVPYSFSVTRHFSKFFRIIIKYWLYLSSHTHTHTHAHTHTHTRTHTHTHTRRHTHTYVYTPVHAYTYIKYNSQYRSENGQINFYSYRLMKNTQFPAHWGTRISLTSSQKPDIWPYPVSDKPSPQHSCFTGIHFINIIPYAVVIPKFIMQFSYIPCMLHEPYIS